MPKAMQKDIDPIPYKLAAAIAKVKTSGLTRLGASHNQLQTVPDEISNLTQLTHLYLDRNQLRELPENIGNLVNLQELFLDNNQLIELPESIGNLLDLKYLYLRSNLLEDLPVEIGNLARNLNELYISDNRLSTFPAGICNLSHLSHLDVADNQIEEIPTAIGKLTKLSYLELGDNRLTALPEEIAHCQELNSLYLSDNRLSSVPNGIVNLPKLKYLDLNGNPIEDLSPLQKVESLEDLRFLDVYLPRRYWTKLSDWKAEWLLDESNVEVRRVLIDRLGYERICHDLAAAELDNWREYTLLKLDGIEVTYDWQGTEIEREPIVLLKMICPSTGHIHILRVPPDLTTAEAAIVWINHGIHPDDIAIQT